jgi:hypothetical protein
VRCNRGEHYEQEEKCGSGNNNIVDNIRNNLHISEVRMDNALIAHAVEVRARISGDSARKIECNIISWEILQKILQKSCKCQKKNGVSNLCSQAWEILESSGAFL